jgi:surface protein
MSGMFISCSVFNQDVSNFDTSNVTTMEEMFRGCSVFNQDVSHFNIEKVLNMTDMFLGSGLDEINYSLLLLSWAAQNEPSNLTFHAGSADYYSGNVEAAKLALEANGWTITDGNVIIDNAVPTVVLSDDNPDLIVRDPDTNRITATFNEEMTSAPTISIDVSTGADADIITASMTNSGDYKSWTYDWDVPAGHTGDTAQVTVAGMDLAGNAYAGGNNINYAIYNTPPMTITVDTSLDAGKTVSIRLFGSVSGVDIYWGDTNTTNVGSTANTYTHTYGADNTYTISISGSFTGYGWEANVPTAANVKCITGVTSWGDYGITSLSGAFRDHVNFNNIPDTEPLNVTNMSNMFYNATAFNQDISNWAVNNVTDFTDMFSGIGGLSTRHYDALLTSWQNDVLTGKTISVNNSKYSFGTSADVARTYIDDDLAWTITDGGSINPNAVWNSGGSANTFTDEGNWDISKGISNEWNLTFATTSDAITWDILPTQNNISLNTGFTGSLTVTSDTDVTIADTLTVNTGTFATDAVAGGAIYTQGASGTLNLTLDSKTSGQYGRINATGNVTLNGTLTVTNDGLTLVDGDSFDLINGTISGTFSTVNLPSLDAGLLWNTSSLYTTGIISVVATSPTSVTVTPIGGIVVANKLNNSNTNMTASATIVAGIATGGRAELLVDGVVKLDDNTILAGDTFVTFDTSDGSPTNAEL